MIKDIAYKKEMLADLFALNKGDIEALIVSEGVPIFSTLDKKFIGYLPSLSSAFCIDDNQTKLRLASNVESKNYVVTLEDSIISISSANPHFLPATSYLFDNKWLAEAKEILNIDENFSILISNRKELPFYCGHTKLITRLAENMSGDIYIENAVAWLNKMEEK